MDKRTLIQRCRSRKQDLWTRRATHDGEWRELAELFDPSRGRWTATDKDRSKKKHGKIYDSTTTGALHVLVSGMVSGMANPNTKFLRLGTSDPELNDFHTVRAWLDDSAERMLRVFRRANTHAAIPNVFAEQALFGTACDLVLPSFKSVIHHHTLTAGMYALATDDLGDVNTMVREYTMTVHQMVAQFGLDRVSQSVRSQYGRGNYDQPITVYHCIEPRSLGERDPNKLDGKNMPYRSVYFEDGGKSRMGDEVLSEGGYRQFPVLAPRWRVVAGNVYGESPAYDALGPAKRLQKMTLVEGTAAALHAQPPTSVPPSLKGREHGWRPGEAVEIQNGEEVREIFKPSSKLADMDILLRRVQDEINQRMFKPLFTAITDLDKQATLGEVREIVGEKLTQLGPTVLRSTREYFAPLVDITLGHMMDQGLLAPPPPELEGQEVKPELVGVLAQAQKASGAQISDQLQAKVNAHAELDPSIRHILDREYDVRDYSDIIGSDPKRLRSPEDFAARVKAEAEAQAAQAQSELMAQGAGAQKDAAAAEAAAGA